MIDQPPESTTFANTFHSDDGPLAVLARKMPSLASIRALKCTHSLFHNSNLLCDTEATLLNDELSLRNKQIIDTSHQTTFTLYENGDKKNLFSLAGSHSVYISPLTVNESELSDDSLTTFKETIQKGRILRPTQKGSSGIKFSPCSNWCSVRLLHNQQRLICIKISIDGEHVFLPYKIFSHTDYQRLHHDQRASNRMIEKFSSRYQVMRIPEKVVTQYSFNNDRQLCAD